MPYAPSGSNRNRRISELAMVIIYSLSRNHICFFVLLHYTGVGCLNLVAVSNTVLKIFGKVRKGKIVPVLN
jgi:hypothetical protein